MPPTRSAAPETDWEKLLLVYLHDPFDKALDVRGHEQRAARYAGAALGRAVTREEMKAAAGTADPLAAASERLPMPTAGRDGQRAVGPADGTFFLHPLSGARTELSCSRPAEEEVVRVVASIVDGLPTARQRFLALWRLLPDRLAERFGVDAARLPADTRLPDHSLFQHADTAAGLFTALSGGRDAAFLSFHLGPVQPFIAAARSVRDLWTGSAILSWLCFQAMKPLLERYGPTAFVYPSLRGAPLADLWLRREAGLDQVTPRPTCKARLAPSLPNRFVALVPWGPDGSCARELRQQCVEAASDAWRSIGAAVREKLDPDLRQLEPGWARHWDSQMAGMFGFHCTAAPERNLDDQFLARTLAGEGEFADAWPGAGAIRRLADAIPPDARPPYDQKQAGRWQAQMEYSARMMKAARRVSNVPASAAADEGPWPAKCTLFGSWEQVGPAERGAARSFWQNARSQAHIEGVRLRDGERLCAVALAKRFAAPVTLAKELGLQASDLRFPDTATVAAASWLAEAGIEPDHERRRTGNWSGQWLHSVRGSIGQRGTQGDDEPDVPEALWERLKEAERRLGRRPPAYYAVLAMDGDRIGRWLAGRSTPPLRRLLHKNMRTWFERLGDERTKDALDAQRPVSPALHTAISGALTTFATEVAPSLVAEHRGTTIYSGGDDLLALCPLDTALACANALRQAFSGTNEPGAEGWRLSGQHPRMTMGAQATMSAGMAIVHYKEDLRTALDAARQAEREAKDAGRDQLRLVTLRRSGERSACSCPWTSEPGSGTPRSDELRQGDRPQAGGTAPRLATAVASIDELRREFVAGASSRWTYKLRAELATLSGPSIPSAALEAEIRRLIGRSEEGDRDRERGQRMAALFRALQDWQQQETRSRQGTTSSRDVPGNRSGAPPIENFVTLCQTAAFMARGRDD